MEKEDQTLATLSCTDEASVLVEKVAQELSKHADAMKSQSMKKYMRDKFDFYGLSAPLRKRVCKEYLQQKLSPADTRKLVTLLWEKPEREFQYFAIDYLEKYLKDLSLDFEANITCMKDLITRKSWWDTVDSIASKVVGYLVKRNRNLGKAIMDEWIDHENMWLRRTALLHQLFYRELTDEKMLFRFCSVRAHEKEFFIRKAIGWALRQHARTSKSNVRNYLLKNKPSLSNLTFREASKHLNI